MKIVADKNIPLKIVADKNIPYLKGVAEQFGEVVYLSGKEFTHESIKDADTLIVRTVTRFDEAILKGTDVKLICSATIGFDHIDVHYCEKNNIVWKNAPGCNSGSVMQYIGSALLTLARDRDFDLIQKTIGIVGVGNVGTKVAKLCQLLGMRVLLNDPPRQSAEQSGAFVDLDTIKREADIITFHTPLTKSGEYKTHHLADGTFFDSLGRKPFIINSARGGIVDTDAIKQALRNKKIAGAVIDCWENEPNIDIEYLHLVDIATPHIAGYSADGKSNATRMSLENLADFWSLAKEPIMKVKAPQVENPVLDCKACCQDNTVNDIILKTYDILKDHRSFVSNIDKFSYLRENYPLRREYLAYTVLNADEPACKVLEELGFKIE